ncbi:hypothetical protein Ddye_016024 [Dipteronia dyeriana]|uniref:SET domain-containing protein n=1 Tax=Dipteronia dyeriana TaxID=168575 RepID=A0AAD9U6S6_9ROSI|nr:hypothetical protein Ddye_016024 [Dipteronia dyeriana]
MAPDPRVARAFKAMKAIGITEIKVKPVLKKLLRLYEKNWELIEEENYRVLADAIFDEEDDAKVSDQKKSKIDEENYEEEAQEEPLRPLKRLRRGQESRVPPSPSNSSPSLGGALLKMPKVEDDELPATSSQHQSQDSVKSPRLSAGNGRGEIQRLGNKGKAPVSAHVASTENRCIRKRSSQALSIREPAVESGIPLLTKKMSGTRALIIPKDEPFTDDMLIDNRPQYEVPIAVIHPDSISNGVSSSCNVSLEEQVCEGPPASSNLNGQYRVDGVPASSSERRSSNELTIVPEKNPSSLEIASSPMGEVKILLSCNSDVGRSNFHMPSIDELRQSMEERCLRSYKIIDPSFSVMNLLQNVCECFLELTTNSSCESQERLGTVTPCDLLTKSTAPDALHNGGSKGNIYTCFADVATPQVPRPLQFLNGLNDLVGTSEDMVANGSPMSDKGDPEFSGSCSLALVTQCQLTPDDLRAIHDVKNITKGEERVEISWVNEVNHERLPTFYYIAQNLVYQNASVNFTLSQIGAEHCCSDCFGNCLATTSAIACACARQTGKFVYTLEGLLDEEFLAECVSITRDPQQQCLLNCRDCPLERSKNEGILEPCKGHLERSIIRECWSKCGCYKQCGNRVVQRGINSKLQVFFTPEGKGWGLRTLEKLPKGAFVCEFVGEIVTTKELYDRNTKKHNCPVLLDAYWVSKGVSKEEEALCLDATNFGNVARFLNHRCFDANLIEIPVEIESPEHHYYHLAFFTTREVDALEELTWDYGVDFDDHDQMSFQCQCGSKFCRNMKRSNSKCFCIYCYGT